MRSGAYLAVVLFLATMLGACVHGSAVNSGRAADANAALGISYLRKGELKPALKKLHRALSYDPDHVKANWGLALAFARLNEPHKAAMHFERALDGSNNPRIRNSYGAFLCGQGHVDKAIEYFQRAVASPRYTRPEYALANAGICLRRAGQVDRAARFLQRALKKDPDYAPALAAMARLQYARADHFNARAYFQRLDAVEQLKGRLLLLAARNELALGERAQAYRYMQRYNQAHPNAHWTLESLSTDD